MNNECIYFRDSFHGGTLKKLEIVFKLVLPQTNKKINVLQSHLPIHNEIAF